MRRCCTLFIFAALFCVGCLNAREQDLLKSTDISRVMKQILEHHDGVKEVSNKVLQNALIVYIDQFDPNRIYLLESEVNPFIHLSQQQLDETVKKYKRGDFTIFKQLNQTIQKSIERSRQLRQGLEADAKSTLFSSKKEDDKFPEYNTFAQTADELKKRLWQNLKRFIQSQKSRFTDTSVVQKKDEILHSYEARLQEFEDEYMGTNEKGIPLPQAEQENLFTIHVLKALASSLDAHTSFYQSNEAYDMRVRLQKEFQGIGLVLKDAIEGAIVTRLLEDGPAAKSGLIQPGDILIEVNRKSVTDLPFEKVMDLLHDSKQSEVTLIFKRPSKPGGLEKIFTVKLKREIIVVNNDRVDWSYENFGNGIIGKIVLHSFYQGDGITSEKDMREAIQKLESKGNLKGLILDLRDNSGGFLSQAIKVAGLFITNGVVVISKYADGEEKIYRDVDGKIAYDGPLVILTSKVTASAAEIVAQALQDYGVALVVGDEHTYGKGTIQTQTVTDNQSTSYFKVTVGKYYTVSGKTPQKDGVKADVVVPGRWNDEPIGEEYLNSPKGDTIAPAYNDDLSDISSDVKSWYLKYYIPKIQHRKNVWRKILPTLKKNSEYRIAHNKNYQFYLKGKVVDDDGTVNEEEEELGVVSNNKKNFGEDDLQMQEAVNVVKDMIMLHSLDLDLESRKSH